MNQSRQKTDGHHAGGSFERLVSRARSQSRALADQRSRQLPSRWEARRSRQSARPHGAHAWSAAALGVLVLAGTGVTWAVIGASSGSPPARETLPLGRSLERAVRTVGPAPATERRPARALEAAEVIEKKPAGRAPRPVAARPIDPAAVAAREAKPSGKITFTDQPNGDVIIVAPKAKQGPLWRPKDFGKYMKMRSRRSF